MSQETEVVYTVEFCDRYGWKTATFYKLSAAFSFIRQCKGITPYAREIDCYDAPRAERVETGD